MTKYRLRKTSGNVEEFECIRETDKQIVYMQPVYGGKTRESRCAKESDYEGFYNSKDEAQNAYIIILQNKIDNAKSRLEYTEKALADYKLKIQQP